MMRQASSRNQRSKGLRVKNVLRWYLLAAACLWLLYQLKHSYDKKRAPEERNLEASEKIVESQPKVLKLGRKELPLGEENGFGNDIHDKEEDNQEVEGEEEDQEIKQAMDDEAAGGDGDDEINEQDQERTDEQEDQERADEEAENGEELTNEEDKDGQGEETEQSDDQDTEEDSFNEAREESYKIDEDGDAGEDTDDMADGADDYSKADSDLSVGAADVSKDNVTGVVFAGNETNHNDHRTMNRTVIERKGSDFGLNISGVSLTSNQIELHSNSTAASVINYHIEALANSTSAVTSNQIETRSNSAGIDAVADSVPLQNETVDQVWVQNHNITIEMENSEQDKTSFKNVVMEGFVERSNRTVGQEDAGEHSFVSLGTIDKRYVIHNELAESSHKMVTEEERDARRDLSTLPAMQNEVKVMVGEAAE